MDKKILRIYAITDRQWLKPQESLAEVVEEAILGGATIVQLRDKYLHGQELKELALQVQKICNTYKVPFIINDDVSLAKEIEADGVHVGQSDMAVAQARKMLGPDKIIGATAKTIEQALKAQEEGADYLGSGAIFGTTTKQDARPMTMELLNSICDSVHIPVVAIGGIHADNIAELADTKVAGAAVVSGIFAQKNVLKSTTRLDDLMHGPKLIQCITNSVTMNQVANVILATGGSPIMAHHIQEVEEVQTMSSALLLNLGATDDYEAMVIAYRTALKEGHPTVIDPVGVGGITYRRDFLRRLLEIGTPTCIRGNYGEIKAIYQDTSTMKGLDCDTDGDEKLVQALARRLSCIVVASGRKDIIASPDRCISLSTGHEMQKRITGSGCMLSAVICRYLCNGLEPTVERAAYACRLMGDTASQAAEETQGVMSFQARWLDLVSL